MNKSLSIPLIISGIINCKPDMPSATLEQANYASVPTEGTNCVYDNDGRMFAMYHGAMTALGLTIKFQDPNKIKSITRSWFGKTKTENCEYTIKDQFNIVGPTYFFREQSSLTYELIDCKGNVKEYNFALEDIIKKSSKTKILNIGKSEECPKKHPQQELTLKP